MKDYFLWIKTGRKGKENVNKFQGGRGHWAVYYTSSQSFIKTIGLTALETFNIKYWLVGSLGECPTIEGIILWIIIGDIHQYIGNCLIPLDPW